MSAIYLMFIAGAVASLLLYKFQKAASYIGFGIPAAASLYGIWYFFMNLTGTEELIVQFPVMAAKFTLDPLGAFFSFVICLVGFAASLYGIHYAEEYRESARIGAMGFFFNLFMVFMLMVVSASHVFWFMVFWELMTLVSFFLIHFNDSEKTAKATILYMVIAHVGGAAILAGMLIMSSAAGSLYFQDFQGTAVSPVVATVLFLLFFFGFGSKAGVFPIHVWLPEAHPAAPSHVSALMSAVMIKTAIYGIIRTCMWLPLNEWWGIMIIVFGALSALLGVLYALTQHDTKALLAYHSVENIGIILLGCGVGFYGMATGNAILAAAGFIGGLYHVINHATFKGLLFLGAGSVIFRTHQQDMEVLGGLGKKMPYTAFAFLIGAMAISALPPLNGFVSEWFTYQSLIQAAIGAGFSGTLIFTMAIVALALTGVLAVMCFVKVYSVIFTGTPRDENIWDKAKESPVLMVAGMFVLVTACIALGLGAPYAASKIVGVITYITGSGLDVAAGITVKSGTGSIVSPFLISVIFVSMLFVPVIFTMIFKDSTSTTRMTKPWACGAKYTSRMQITASPFTGFLRQTMNWLYRSDVHFKETNGYFGKIEYSSHARDIWWDIIYTPIIKGFSGLARMLNVIQNGRMQIYASYVLIMLALFIILAIFG
ncbi:MAG TPA: proton-conducting transporter membrane subunit [Spirochaetota bacterium]|nr:proton-conducting transporter membrane subunit [Spirochaetota bacterium]HPJ36483.1 proton-conducting transporter membrane subunit [Spirochaetota bacterium]